MKTLPDGDDLVVSEEARAQGPADLLDVQHVSCEVHHSVQEEEEVA